MHAHRKVRRERFLTVCQSDQRFFPTCCFRMTARTDNGVNCVVLQKLKRAFNGIALAGLMRLESIMGSSFGIAGESSRDVASFRAKVNQSLRQVLSLERANQSTREKASCITPLALKLRESVRFRGRGGQTR